MIKEDLMYYLKKFRTSSLAFEDCDFLIDTETNLSMLKIPESMSTRLKIMQHQRQFGKVIGHYTSRVASFLHGTRALVRSDFYQ